MNRPLVKSDNKLVWDGLRQPFHESYTVKINDSNGKWALTLRYVLATPSPGYVSGMASLWAVYEERGADPVALRRDFDMSVYDVVHADEFIRVGDAWLSLANCHGGIATPAGMIKWELAFEDPVASLRHYPHTLFYRSPFPATKFCSPRLSGFVTGSLFINHKKIHLLREKVHQNHSFGEMSPASSAWVNCISFREDSSAYVEGVSAVLPVGRGQIFRPCHLFCVGMDGRRFVANSPVKALWRNRSRHDFRNWEFEFEKSGFRFETSVRREGLPISEFVIPGTDGKPRFSLFTAFATTEIRISRRRRGAWLDYKQMTSDRCAFETVTVDRAG